eukprot:6458325-Amphidinium_carterae.2
MNVNESQLWVKPEVLYAFLTANIDTRILTKPQPPGVLRDDSDTRAPSKKTRHWKPRIYAHPSPIPRSQKQ